MNPLTSCTHSAFLAPFLGPAPLDGEGFIREPANPLIASIRNHNDNNIRGAHRIAEHLELGRLGRQDPIVINGLLQHAHVSYCMAWKRRVNAHSRPITVLHTSCGPDLSTVLLATNANRIIAVDRSVPTVYGLNLFLSHWHTIDTDPTIAFDEARKKGMKWDQDPDAMMQMLLPPFKRMLKVRRERGFWNDTDIMGSFVDRLTVIELKKMGVQLSGIQVHPSESDPAPPQPLGETQLIFDWAYPGEEPRPRTIDYVRSHIASLFSGALGSHIPPVDGLYQKARNGDSSRDRALVRDAQSLILAGGFILMGGSSHIGTQQGLNEPPDALQELGPEFQTVQLEDIYNRLMGTVDPYGWKLYGSRRLG